MDEENIKSKALNATKWSTITELAAKLVTPVTNMILARIVSPEAFGVVATVTMVISFAEMFADSGFQKYLVQHDFDTKEKKDKSANVAFWTNLIIAIILWLIIFLFRNPIAILVGNPGLGNVIVIACFQLPLTSFSSIQMALFRRNFDFKTLFIVRMITVFIPIVITIPLALLGLSYWSLIIGNISMQLANAFILTLKSDWKPKLSYSFKLLHEMISFSIWSLIEAISIWLTAWIDTFIIARFLNQYYLGIYKTSTSMVNSLMNLITAPVVPVLFSTLSRLQNNDNQFKEVFYYFQKAVSIIVLPLGIGVFLYRDLATNILLGSQWLEAGDVIGLWALSSSLVIVFGYFNSEVYRAKGKPKISFLSQVLHLIFLVPTLLISGKFGFSVLVLGRTLARLQSVIVGVTIMKYKMGFPVIKTIKNVLPMMISSVIMGFMGYFLQQIGNGLVWSLISIIFCIVFYFSVLILFPGMRNELMNTWKLVKNKKMNI